MPSQPPARTKPLLRGVFHSHAFFAALFGGALLVAAAPGSRTAAAAAVYVASLVGLLGTSALYHRPMWSERTLRKLRRLDHSMIFVLIAGTYTPMCLLALPEPLGGRLLAAVWAGAALGIVRALAWPRAPRLIVVGLYLALGWAAVIALPAFVASADATDLALLGAGGLLYSVGAIMYGLRRPDPWPSVFGFHEVFHLLVVVAAVCHFAAIARLVLGGA